MMSNLIQVVNVKMYVYVLLNMILHSTLKTLQESTTTAVSI
jgi:hypothetical protein